MDNPKEVLMAARDNIDHEDKWIKGLYTGSTVEGCDAFCAVGALYAVFGCDNPQSLEIEILAEALLDIDTTYYDNFSAEGNITNFNDKNQTTHSDVMRLYNRAIEIVEETQSSHNEYN